MVSGGHIWPGNGSPFCDLPVGFAPAHGIIRKLYKKEGGTLSYRSRAWWEEGVRSEKSIIVEGWELVYLRGGKWRVGFCDPRVYTTWCYPTLSLHPSPPPGLPNVCPPAPFCDWSANHRLGKKSNGWTYVIVPCRREKCLSHQPSPCLACNFLPQHPILRRVPIESLYPQTPERLSYQLIGDISGDYPSYGWEIRIILHKGLSPCIYWQFFF